ncbi:MAG: winged helix-turn-helix transcriptional regulator [Paludibacteraceae bacterium]
MLTHDEIQDALFPLCPVRNVLSRVGDKWSLLVLNTLSSSCEPMRFNTLQRALPDISQKVLSATLRTLEEDGFLIRTVYAEVPPRVDYRLTERARSFMQACTPMIEWATNHLDAILSDRKQRHTK